MKKYISGICLVIILLIAWAIWGIWGLAIAFFPAVFFVAIVQYVADNVQKKKRKGGETAKRIISKN